MEYDRVSYTQKAYDEQGESRNLTFTASQSLKLDKYLKITHKGAHVATYEEVNKQDIPKKAIEEIEK
ncbi:YxeA family protein [Staphylococcus cohnii]|uniref:YxeA family protein n=1 Tax=Staphylococcus cohnii TaxID=29382 RepID=UPI000E6975D9|nr:YxeA family protein [Staphylococcus cohnii]RIL79226.1 YxeA family protein [Staphylococcus cohnii]